MQILLGGVGRLRLVVLSALVACTSPPVEWTGERTVRVANSGVALSPGGTITGDSLAPLRTRLAPPSAACTGSLQLSRSGGKLFAVWWSPRADSSASLASAYTSDDGATWSAVVPVDMTDRGMTGCARTPPSIAADAASGYVHVTYAMLAAEGPGLFFSHSMDGGASFHEPVPILYGERLGRTSVASAGDRVAVAFEDPNSRTPRIGLALSKSMGHIFEVRLLPVSDNNGAASQPLVAVEQHRMTVAWQERATKDGGVVLRIRTGTFP